MFFITEGALSLSGQFLERELNSKVISRSMLGPKKTTKKQDNSILAQQRLDQSVTCLLSLLLF